MSGVFSLIGPEDGLHEFGSTDELLDWVGAVAALILQRADLAGSMEPIFRRGILEMLSEPEVALEEIRRATRQPGTTDLGRARLGASLAFAHGLAEAVRSGDLVPPEFLARIPRTTD